MNYERFDEEINLLGLKTNHSRQSVYVTDRDNTLVCLIRKDTRYALGVFKTIGTVAVEPIEDETEEEIRGGIFELCVELAKTPPEERGKFKNE